MIVQETIVFLMLLWFTSSIYLSLFLFTKFLYNTVIRTVLYYIPGKAFSHKSLQLETESCSRKALWTVVRFV